MKKICSVILAVLMAFVCLCLPLSAYDRTFEIYFNSAPTGVQAVVSDGVLYVPLASVCRLFGTAETKQSGTSETVTVRGITIAATENSFQTEANGRVFYHGGCARRINGELFIPMATVYRIFGCDYFAAGNGVLYIDDNGALCQSGEDYYNADDLYWLSRIISAESRGEPEKGKIAVGNVVMNRVASAQFPNSIYAVIFDKKYGVQFTPAANGTVYANPSAESVSAAKACLDGACLSDEILYFYCPALSPNAWAGRARPYAFTIGGHIFCK